MKFKKLLGGKFATDSIWMLISYSVVAASGILVNFILGHFYGPDAVGVFNQSYSLFQIFAVVGAMGINFSTVKHVAEYKDDISKVTKIFSTSQVLTFLISFLVSLVIIIVISVFPGLMSSDNVRRATLLITISLPFFVSNKNQWSYYIGFRRMREYSMFRLFRWVVILFIIIIWSLLKLSMVYAVAAFLISDVLLSVMLHILNAKAFSFSDINKGWALKHLNFGYKSILTEVLSSVYARIPIILIGYFLGDKEAGMYSIAATMASGILIIASILQDNFNPVVANLHSAGDVNQLENYVRKLRRFSLLSLLPLVIGSVILYKIYIFFLGSEYKGTSTIFYILITGVGLSYLVSWAGGVLTMTGNQMLNLLRLLITLVITVGGCLIFVPALGATGAAIAFSFSAVVNIVVLYFFILKRTKIKIL
jgi:O-antigen/teichoic acid export membrane protein